MKAILLPYSALCGACGNLMFLIYPRGEPAITQVVVYCTTVSCVEHHRHYAFDLATVELKPVPTTEEP